MFIKGKLISKIVLRKCFCYFGICLAIASFFYANVSFAKENAIPAEYQSLPTINVVDLGADPSGHKDSGPAFRKAGGSNRIIFIPPGTYHFSSTVKAPCCAYDPEAVLYAHMNNFLITGYGATLVADDNIALSGLMRLDQCKNFAVRGLSFRGSRNGLADKKENGALGFSSVVNFKISDINIGKGFEVNGDGIGGDWWVNGVLENVTMDGVGHCDDVAYLQHVVFKNFKCRGRGHGESCGMTGISFIEDPPNQNQNFTGVEFDTTDDVSIIDSDISNFDTGAFLSTGEHVSLRNNVWHDNTGSSHVLGIGVLIKINKSYKGQPPHDIHINDKFDRNTVAIKIDGTDGSAEKSIKNVSIKSEFSQNKKGVDVQGAFVHGITRSDLPI